MQMPTMQSKGRDGGNTFKAQLLITCSTIYMVFVKQVNPNLNWEVFTIDGLYTDEEITQFKKYIVDADPKNRTFTSSPFKNGKVIHEWSKLMYQRIQEHLPESYTDQRGQKWRFLESAKYIMYANIEKSEQFGIHTDTGCEYDQVKNKYSKFTVLTYLNHDYQGGNTIFYDDNFNKTFTIDPLQNRTLIFDINVFHSGEQVVQGSKFWIGTELVCAEVND